MKQKKEKLEPSQLNFIYWRSKCGDLEALNQDLMKKYIKCVKKLRTLGVIFN